MQTMLSKICQNCKTPFDVTDVDAAFYKKMKIPSPNFCPDCRQQRRLAFRNERYLYHRNCDLCGKKVVSIYHPSVSLKVYCTECWWSDKWDPLAYGQDFDFNRPFFDQFAELKNKVPHIALYWRDNENADYINMSGYNKNCYLIFAAEYNEDCLYGTQVIKSKDCVDTLDCLESENCYEVTDVSKCYEVFFSKNCRNCHTSMFLYDCKGCADCMFCTNLRNKTNYIFNTHYSKETYENFKEELLEKINNGELPGLINQFHEIEKLAIHRDLEAQNNENSVGSYLFDSKNCLDCYDLSYGEDCRYVYTGFHVKDMMDVAHTTDAELGYEAASLGYNSYNAKFAIGSWTSHNIEYIDTAASCSDLFGCAGIKYKKFCVFNKQYSEDDYKILRNRIIEHMKKGREYGEFFPIQISPFAYNETLANDYYPLAKEQALAKNYQWRDKEEKEYRSQTYVVPKNITEVLETIIDEVLACKTCGKNFKITPQELKFYKRYNLPVPEFCPDCRQKARLNLRPQRKLFQRNCSKCHKQITTTYPQNSPEMIFCESCYLETIK